MIIHFYAQPSDLVQQSLPFSYMALEFSSLDGQPHEVELYSDISAGEGGGSLRLHALC